MQDFIVHTVAPRLIKINATKVTSAQMVSINNLVLLGRIKIYLDKLRAQIAQLETTAQTMLPPPKTPVQSVLFAQMIL